MVDGSVQSISRELDPTVLDLMAQRDDGEPYDVNGVGPKRSGGSNPNPF